MKGITMKDNKQLLDLLHRSLESGEYHQFNLGNGMLCVGVEDEPDVPKTFSIIFDNGMTAVVWEDGSVTKTHLREGDTFDPLIGIMACTVRKLTHNRGHAVDECEDCVREIAAGINKPSDIDALIDFNLLMLDTLTVLKESQPLWDVQLGERPVEKQKQEKVAERQATRDDIRVLTQAEIQRRLESQEAALRDRERTSQMIRNLVDRGEL